jgi:4-alpha-glucanotransferase
MNGTEIDLNNLSSYWKCHSKKLKRSLGFYKNN